MKSFIAVALVVCLAVAVHCQMGAPAAEGRATNPLAAMGRMAGGRMGGMNLLTMGALSGRMGDGFSDMLMCRMFNLPPMMCMMGLIN